VETHVPGSEGLVAFFRRRRLSVLKMKLICTTGAGITSGETSPVGKNMPGGTTMLFESMAGKNFWGWRSQESTVGPPDSSASEPPREIRAHSLTNSTVEVQSASECDTLMDMQIAPHVN
jgi:hypothetical protein